jgi:hypothetical protein
MKLFSAAIAAIAASLVNGVQQNSDIYYHEKQVLGPSMWHFSSDGLTIYSPDGSRVLKEHLKSSLCQPYESMRGGGTVEDCYFFSMASDGHKYVWAGTLAGTHRVEAFDIDSGEYAGYMPTCSTPLDLEYHPTRQEMWLRCAQEDIAGGHPGEIDVFSSNSLSQEMEHIYLNKTGRPYGRLAIHSSMGTYGYASALDQPELVELDLSSKEVEARHKIPDAYGAYDMTYSPVNQHIFARTRVCCTCGSPTADVAECGRGGSNVNIKTGPSAGQSNVTGACGNTCEGTNADTLGVVEFDTVGKTIVGYHNIRPSTGFGADPVSSPDGKYILMLPNDGGQFARLLMPGANGAHSRLIYDIPCNFKGGSPGRSVISDMAFVQDDRREILVIGASTDNDLVIVDLGNAEFPHVKLSLTDATESTGGTSRKLEWAVGTNYVWVNGGETKEVYVIELPDADINNARVVRTVSGVTSGNMIFVNNYERERLAREMALMMRGSVSANVMNSKNMNAATSNNTNTVAVVGLIVAAVAVVVSLIVALLALKKPVPTGGDDSEQPVDTKSLGSKNVA